MTHPYLAAGLAREHERDLRAAAARARLAAIANCCRPSRLLRAARTNRPLRASVCDAVLQLTCADTTTVTRREVA